MILFFYIEYLFVYGLNKSMVDGELDIIYKTEASEENVFINLTAQHKKKEMLQSEKTTH